MTDQGRICEYDPRKLDHNVQQTFYKSYYDHRKRSWIGTKMKTYTRWWSYGLVAILAHAASQPPSFARTLLADTSLWSLSFGVSCYLWLSHIYNSNQQQSIAALAHSLDTADDDTKLWVMLQGSSMAGVILLRLGTDEAQIQVTAFDPSIEMALVQTAIQSARDQGIAVVTQVHSRKSTLDGSF
ncbi:hypothetical protein DM01DRAFT_1339826 [Hesseltinella vesiculosa]|uniref:Uncharacterized protein n=1 Tax=Hesseltinella vesiculosa TaxID=101127 RepID=A0A1X2G5V9_9FUNG|nr:hypothetical protein DM01DRAFT_1339826 [Hesseltinella vesiculosa]